VKVTSSELCEVSRRAADRLIACPWKVWFWGDSVGLEGLLDASATTGDPKFGGFVYGIMKAWAARWRERSEWEYTAAGVALMRVYETTRDPALLELAREHAAYLAGFRKSDRGIHIRYENAAFDRPPDISAADGPLVKTVQPRNGGPCAFVDTMHFDAPFFAALFSATNEEKYRSLAIETLGSQIDVLFDEEAGLFHHFWIESSKRRNEVLWGRGNGWALLGLVHTLEALPDAAADFPQGLATLQRQAAALARLQDQSGHWHTILDDPSSYLETSVAAFVIDGFSVAMRHGWIDRSYQAVVARALDGLIASVRPDGVLDGVSFETFPSTNAEHYRRMPRGALVPWGQGPLLTAIHSFLLKVQK